jgi:ATP-dependent Clp protease adaptor protein ClpS
MSQKKINPSDGAGDTDLIDKEKSKKKVRPPSKYQVIFYNDDFTPMELVASVLVKFYHHDDSTAWKITMDIHKKGKGIAGGPYPKGIAETKAKKTVDVVRYMGYPLLAKAEKVE